MKDASKSSNDIIQESDASVGYISLTDLQNVWTTRMRALDQDVWPAKGRMPYRDEVIEFFATLRLDLFARAKKNYVEFCRRVPDPALRAADPNMGRVKRARPEPPPPEESEKADSEKAYQERRAKLAKWTTPT